MSVCKGRLLDVEHSGFQVFCQEYPVCMDDDICEVSTAFDMDLVLQQLESDNLVSNMSRIPPKMLSPALRSPLGACTSGLAGSRKGRQSSKIVQALCPVE